jgi:hypothetical protein
MPKIYEYIGFIFFFYSIEHLPIHCHVKKGEREIKAELQYKKGKLMIKFLKVKGKRPFNDRDLNEIVKFIGKYHMQKVEKWKTFLFTGKNLVLRR